MSFEPTECDLQLHRRCDFTASVQLLSSTGAAKDLTGWSFKAELATAYGTVPVKNFSVSVSLPTSGLLELSLTAADVTSLAAGTYYWDLLATANSKTAKLLYGTVTVNDTVSD